MRIFPADGERFVDLQILTSLHTPPAKDALVRVVPIEGIRFIDFVGLGSIRDALMLNLQQGCRIVNGAIAVVIVANGTIQKVVP